MITTTPDPLPMSSDARIEEVDHAEFDHVAAVFALLVELRKEQNLTQADIAERMGCAPRKVMQMERHHRSLTLVNVFAYAKAVAARVTLFVDVPNDPTDPNEPVCCPHCSRPLDADPAGSPDSRDSTDSTVDNEVQEVNAGTGEE